MRSKHPVYTCTISLLLVACLAISGAAYSVTGNKYIVQKEYDYAATVPDKKESLRLDRKLFESLVCPAVQEVDSVTIIELPDSGTLTHGKDVVVVLDTFDLSPFKVLRYTPSGSTTGSFCFIAADKKGNTTPLCRLTVTPAAAAFSPVAVNITLQTGRNMKAQGTLQADDPSASSLVYELLSAPKKGDLTFNSKSASFVYTPHKDEDGADSFTYTVRNAEGIYAKPADVKVRIDKGDGEVFYTDMQDSLNHYAAQQLAKAGVVRGTRVGGVDFFHPEQTLSRGEYLVMLMDAAQVTAGIPTISTTGLKEDSTIPMWMKSYVTAAFSTGIVQGDPTNGDLLFDANASVTLAEAAVMTANILGAVQEDAPPVNGMPDWAAPAVSALARNGVALQEGDALDGTKVMTRGDAVPLLWAVYQQTNGNKGFSLFGRGK